MFRVNKNFVVKIVFLWLIQNHKFDTTRNMTDNKKEQSVAARLHDIATKAPQIFPVTIVKDIEKKCERLAITSKCFETTFTLRDVSVDFIFKVVTLLRQDGFEVQTVKNGQEWNGIHVSWRNPNQSQ